MSRIGKQPIVLPAGVLVNLRGENSIIVKGPKGSLEGFFPEGVTVKILASHLEVGRLNDSKKFRSLHGLTRARIANMVKGAMDGFSRQLEINGVGYRAEVIGNKISLFLGLSHIVELPIPLGVQVKVEKTKSTVNLGQDAVLLTISGIDNEVLGQFVSKIRNIRKVEPYKGKGVKYLNEKVKRKVGKTGAS